MKKIFIIKNVPIGVNKDLRPSRLARNSFTYMFHSIKTILDVLLIYRAFRLFFILGLFLFLLGIGFGGYDFYLTWTGQG